MQLVKINRGFVKGYSKSSIVSVENSSGFGDFQMYTLKGSWLRFEEFVKMLTDQFQNDIRKASQYQRSNPYRVTHRKGMSGCLSFFVEWAEPVGRYSFRTNRKKVLHVTMSGKVGLPASDGEVSCFFPDLVEVLKYIGAIDEDLQPTSKIHNHCGIIDWFTKYTTINDLVASYKLSENGDPLAKTYEISFEKVEPISESEIRNDFIIPDGYVDRNDYGYIEYEEYYCEKCRSILDIEKNARKIFCEHCRDDEHVITMEEYEKMSEDEEEVI